MTERSTIMVVLLRLARWSLDLAALIRLFSQPRSSFGVWCFVILRLLIETLLPWMKRFSSKLWQISTKGKFGRLTWLSLKNCFRAENAASMREKMKKRLERCQRWVSFVLCFTSSSVSLYQPNCHWRTHWRWITKRDYNKWRWTYLTTFHNYDQIS